MRTAPTGLGERGFAAMLIASAVLHVLLFGAARLRQAASPPPPSIAVELSPLGGGGFEKAPDKPLPDLPAAAPKASAAPAAEPDPEPDPEPEIAEAPPPRPDDAVVPAAKPQPPKAKTTPKPKAPDKAKEAAKPKTVSKADGKPKSNERAAGSAAGGKGGSGDSTSALADIRQLLEARKGQGGGQGAGGGNSREFGLPDGVPGRLYFRSVDAAIRAVWMIPPGSVKGAVEIEIIIGADGRLISHTLRTPSGDDQLDRSATRAVERATLPPPPAEFRTPLRLILRLIPSEESTE